MMTAQPFIHRQFMAQAAQTPDRTAVVFEGREVSYAELDRMSSVLAVKLRALGAGPDVLIGICMERSIELPAALLGIMKAGAAYVPLDPDYPQERLDYMLQDSGVRIVLSDAAYFERFESFDGRLIGPEVWEDEAIRLAEGMDDSSLTAEHLAYMFYTSGSTGRPKGAMNTHGAIVDRLEWLQRNFDMKADDRLLQKSPYSFDVSVWEFFWPLLHGACLVVAKPKGHLDNGYLWDILQRERITMVQFVPTMLQSFLADEAAAELPHLRQVFLCGEPLTPALHERYVRMMNVPLHNLYGPTEAAVFATNWTSDGEPGRAVIPIGHAVGQGAMYVLDEHYRPVPQGEIGELFIGGIGPARGYHGRPDLTAERFVPDPFSSKPGARMYHTGDLGRMLFDGSLECLGRNDDQVKLRGYRIELGEVAAVLEQHAHIRQAVAIIREDRPGDQRLAVYYIPDDRRPPSVSELRTHMQRQLPEYMIPSYFVEMEAFPLTPSGKTDRKALPSPVLARGMIGHAYVAPESLLQQELAAIWSTFFEFDEIGIDDDFIDLGGHSLVAAQILVRVQQQLGVKVSLKDMLTRGTTIRTLAAVVEEQLLADTDEQELAELLNELEHLSEEEIAELLKS